MRSSLSLSPWWEPFNCISLESGSWEAEGGETKKEVILERVQGITGWAADGEGNFALSPGIGPATVPPALSN